MPSRTQLSLQSPTSPRIRFGEEGRAIRQDRQIWRKRLACRYKLSLSEAPKTRPRSLNLPCDAAPTRVPAIPTPDTGHPQRRLDKTVSSDNGAKHMAALPIGRARRRATRYLYHGEFVATPARHEPAHSNRSASRVLCRSISSITAGHQTRPRSSSESTRPE